MRKVILATIGSLGDLHPFIAVGVALRASGVPVEMACAAEYREKVERAGLLFRAVRPSFDDMQSALRMDRAAATDAMLTRGDFLLRKLIMPHLEASYEDMLDIVAGAGLVLTSSLAFAARMAAQRNKIPWIGIVLQPSLFLSAFDPPQIPHAPGLSALLRSVGPKPSRFVLKLARYWVNRQLGPAHALRARLGLEPAGHPLFEGQFGAAGAIGLYSRLLGDAQPDYPKPSTIAGFACFDSDDGAPPALEASLHEFLDAGPPPLVFTLGSLIVNSPGRFFDESLNAARRLKSRAVLLVGEHGLTGFRGRKSAGVHVAGYAPHSLLFPHAAAIVHQGGIGTLAQALRSGRPQLVIPFFGDQADNAARAVRLGVARSMTPRRYNGASAARGIGLLLSLPRYGVRAAQVGRVVSEEDGASAAAAIVLSRLEDGKTS